VIFSGMKKPLDAEQWLLDTIDLSKAAQVLEENQVRSGQDSVEECSKNMVVGRGSKTGKPVTWDQFLKSFYERFSSDGIKRDERIIYHIAVGGLNYRQVCCKVPKA